MTGEVEEASARSAEQRRGRIFVGRKHELEELEAALADAVAGNGSLVLIGGEPGIGKTRLVSSLAERASAAGATVLWGPSWEGGGAPPYWPWIQVIRKAAQGLTRDELADRIGGGGAYLAHLVPELGDRLGDVGEPPATGSDAARFALFDAAAGFLRASAARQPLMVALDDLHAADHASLLLLQFVARVLDGERLLVVGTYRDSEARQQPEVATLLSELARQGRQLPLRGLHQTELAQLVEARGQRAAPDLTQRLHALTNGNPFFADEIVQLLAADGALGNAPTSAESLILPLPDSIRETIRRRLTPLSPGTVEALGVAAILGREFSVATLAAATAMPAEGVVERLEEACAAGILVARPDLHYAFGHALTRDTLYGDLPRNERMRMHRLVGETLERTREGEAHLSEIAHHFFEAGPSGDRVKAIDYATRAGDQAITMLAYEEAAASYSDALRSLDADERRGRLLLRLGQAQMRAGRLAEARATLHDAAKLADERGEGELYVDAALSSAPWGLSTTVADAELEGFLAGALRRLEGGDTPRRARVMAALARTLYWSQDRQRRDALVEEAIAVARRIGDPATLARVLGDCHIATWDPDSPERSLPWAEEMLELAEQVGDTELALDAHAWRISLLLELGDQVRAQQGIDTFARLADDLRQPRARCYVARHRALRALTAGRHEEAQAAIEESAAMAASFSEDAIVQMLVAAQTFFLRSAQGRLAELEPAMRLFAEGNPAMPVWQIALLSVQRAAGRHEALAHEFAALAADDFAGIPRDNLWLTSLALLAEVCWELRDPDAAGTLADLLAPYAERNVVVADAAFVAPVSRFLGLLAAAREDWEGALAHYAAAAATARRMNARPAAVQLAIDEAVARAARGAPGDGERAARLLSDALTAARELGMDAVASQAEALGGSTPPAGPAAQAPRAGRLERQGDYWLITFDDESLLLKDGKGVRHLARLVAEPDTELHVLELAGGQGPTAARPAPEGELSLDADGGAPVLDPRAKAEYRDRIAELRSEVEEAEAFNDPERAARAREEMDFIARELSAALGLAGRDRKTATGAERARVNVTRAIRTTIDRIRAESERCGRHLDASVSTGTFCCYRPEPGTAEWVVSP
ncbi:MAG: AAA family ATPase [Solirubrobacteraceae bacterium]